MLVGSKSNLIQCFGHARVLFFASFCAVVLVCVCVFEERMREVFVFFFVSMCVDLPAFLFAHMYAWCVCPMNANMHTHARTGGRHVLSWQHIQMSTKEAPG